MAFTEMNDIEQEFGGEKPPEKNGNRTFMIIAGLLGGVMVMALLCIAGLALFRYLPNQRADQSDNATAEAKANALVLAGTQTYSAVVPTATRKPTIPPTNTKVPTNPPVTVIAATRAVDVGIATINAMRTQKALSSPTQLPPTAEPTLPPTLEPATAEPTAQPTAEPPTEEPTAQPTVEPTTAEPTAQPTTQELVAQVTATLQPTSQTASDPTPAVLPQTGIADELGTPGLMAAAFTLIVTIFIVRRLRTAS